MSASTTYGRFYEPTTVTGTGNGSYDVPNGKFAIFEAVGTAGSITATVNGVSYFSILGNNGTSSVLRMVPPGQTISWTWAAPIISANYKISIFNTTTLP